MAKYKEYILDIEGVSVPIRVYAEWRKSTRISMASKAVILRIPKFLSTILLKTEIERAKVWCEKHFKQRPELLEKYRSKEYFSGEQFTVLNQTFTLQLSHENRKTAGASVKGEEVIIKLPSGISGLEQSKVIKKLLSRSLAKAVYHDFCVLVHDINKSHFKKTINDIKLKYNRTNWGSCSSMSNLNFSTRLLLAPLEVIKYVIVHELAHLEELNHSYKFWNIVERVMPDYRKKEEWLKQMGHSCDF